MGLSSKAAPPIVVILREHTVCLASLDAIKVRSQLTSQKISVVSKFQVMPESCRKFSRYDRQEFHLMTEPTTASPVAPSDYKSMTSSVSAGACC